MTITLDLPKDVELQLQEQARASGRNLSEFILATLSQVAQLAPTEPYNVDDDINSERPFWRGVFAITPDRENIFPDGLPPLKEPLPELEPDIYLDPTRVDNDESE